MIVIKTFMITSILAILMSGLISSSPYAFAVKPDPGFLGTLNCNIFAPGSPIKNTTCCWKESNGDRYCQTCQWEEGIGYTVCNDKELQMLDLPPNPPPSTSSGPSAPIQDDGVLEQTDKPNKGGVMNLPNSNEGVLGPR